MTTIAQDEPCPVTGGVDTHKDVHVVAVLDAVGRLKATASFPTTRHSSRRMLRWLQSHGELVSVGIEGCGSWGAGLARYFTERNVTVVEVDRPNRQNRRLHARPTPSTPKPLLAPSSTAKPTSPGRGAPAR